MSNNLPNFNDTYRLARDGSGFKTLIARGSDGETVAVINCPGSYVDREAMAERIVDSLNHHRGRVLLPVDGIEDGRGVC